MSSLNGKRALIVGASTGIGAAVAIRYAAAGATVCLTCKSNPDKADAIAEKIKASGGEAFVVCEDASTAEGAANSVARAAKLMGGVDILINNAGAMFGRTPIATATSEQLRNVIDLNIGSVLYACQAATPLFVEQGSGCIINTSSIAARTGGGAGVGVYGSAKAFVSTMTRVLARELAPEGIRVNAVAPGTIKTPFHERDSTSEQLASVVGTIPMGRLGTPEDCAGAYLFLADEMLSGYITGQVIEVNGGQLMP